MKKRTNDKVTAYGTFGTFIQVEENSNKIMEIAEAAEEVPNFNDKVGELIQALLFQSIPTTGLKDETEVALEALARCVKKYGMKTAPLAEKAGQLNLANIVGKPMTYYTKTSLNLASERAQIFKKAMDDNKSPGGLFTNVKAADILIIDNLIKDFDKKRKAPKSTKTDLKTKGTDKVPGLTKQIDKSMHYIYGFVYGELIDDDADFVNSMAATMKAPHTGVRHTGLTVIGSYEEPPAGVDPNVIKGMNVRLVELDLSTTTNLFGVGSLREFVAGSYTLECWGDGLVAQSFVVTIKRGNILQVNVKMKRV